MPLSRVFLEQHQELVPSEELRGKKVTLLLTKASHSGILKLFELADLVMSRTNHLAKATSVLARLIKALVSKDRSRIQDKLSPADISVASKIMFASCMKPTIKAHAQGKLSTLRVFQNQGIWYTAGRVGRTLESLLGCNRLPVLMPETHLARLIMWQSHEEDHRRTSTDALARSREKAWIVRGGRLAKTICSYCPKCRLERKRVQQQVMSDIPPHQLVPCPPFTNISLDFLGPYQVRGLANQRAKVKVYGLVVVCQNTRAVKLLPVPGYDTQSFMLAYVRFTSNFGTPALICSDRGSQLVKAGGSVETSQPDTSGWEWPRIVDSAAKSGTKWVFVESGCQWRNGLVERQVALLKKTMSSVLQTHNNLNYAEIDTLFASAANTINQRPLAVRNFSQEDYRSITPNDLLLGRNRLPVQPDNVYGNSDNLTVRLQTIKDMEELWWKQWYTQVFPSLVPFRKWKSVYRNLHIGDIVLVMYASKVAKGDYRLARVTNVHPDHNGMVRTVTVSMRPRDSREKVLSKPPYLNPKQAVELVVGVQRLVVILPIEEQSDNNDLLTVPDKSKNNSPVEDEPYFAVLIKTKLNVQQIGKLN